MEDNENTRSLEKSGKWVTNGLKILLASSFLVCIVQPGPLYLLVGMINHLQLVTHLPMVPIPVPANIFFA